MNDVQGSGIKHANNFGVLRLLFASLVIVSHSPEMVDGNRSRELLTRIFGTMSFGEVAVDAFFLVSGYLISQSFARTPSPASYMFKRVGRIVPGYLVSFTLCFFVLAPLVGGHTSIFSMADLRSYGHQTSRLLHPDVPGAFGSLPYHDLNGSMWTIAYEFRCYLAVLAVGLIAGKQPRLIVPLAFLVALALAVAASGVLAERHVRPMIEESVGQIGSDIRFAGVFGVGALFFLLRHRVPLTGVGAALASALLVVGMTSRWTAEPSFAVFGGYLIFWAAFCLPTSAVSRWTDRTDISYGLYLYAWPVGNSLVYLDHGINPWFLCGVTILAATTCGALSWTLIEKPSIKLAHRLAGRFGGKRTLSRPVSATKAASA